MANEYLKRTTTSAGNQRTWTWAGWVKLNNVSDAGELFQAGNDATPTTGDLTRIIAMDNNAFCLLGDNTSGMRIINDGDNRDPAQWYHVVAAYDSTAGLEEERGRIFVNGVKIKKLNAGGTFPAINKQYAVNAGITSHHIGINGRNFTNTLEGELSDIFFVDGQALTPDVFGFYKEGKGYVSAGSTQSTDFRPGQWVPKAPRTIKSEINRKGGFGVNGFYLPMNDSSNFGADFHCAPNSIITLKGEDLPQPRNGAPTTTDAYVSQLRTDPYAANLVLAVPGISGGQGSGYGDYSADIKGSGSNKTVTANGNATVATTASYYGSALSFDGTGDYFQLTDNGDFNASGDFTIEFWANLSLNDANAWLFSKWNSGSNQREYTINVTSGGRVDFYWSTDGTTHGSLQTPAGVISADQWNHYVWEKNGSVLTGYINGVAVVVKTDLTSQYHNSSNPVYIGSLGGSQSFDGQIQDLRVYKGVAKYKGGFDVPKPYTPVGIGTWRAVPDTTANNFATWNAVQNEMSLTDGNLTCTSTGSNQEVYSTIGITTGKWYVEARTNAGTYNHFGVRANSTASYGSDYRLIARDDGNVYGDTSEGLVATLSDNYNQVGDIVAMAIDGNLGQITYYINGTNVGGPYSIYQYNSSSLPTPYKIYNLANSGDSLSVNFGQNPTFSGNTTAGTYTDANGKGLFKYQPPSGFLALCEDNLPAPAIADPGDYFKTVLWTGDGNSGRSITGVGFKPDFVWIGNRDRNTYKPVYDSVRGATNMLRSNTTAAEGSFSTVLNSFDSDGFTVGTDSAHNANGEGIVAWCWKAGGSSNTFNVDGTGYATASAAGITEGNLALTGASINRDAGFSIVTFSANNSASATIGHGLNNKPKWVIVKDAANTDDWQVKIIDDNLYLKLNSSDASSTSYPNYTATDTVINLGYTWNNGSGTHVAYCWEEIENFSKFGSYTGNNDADGPMVYCGFRPAWVLIKRTTTNGYFWTIYDNARKPTNPVNHTMTPDQTNLEVTNGGNGQIDFLSNGFKCRNTDGGINASGVKYVFAAFAESPFQTANSK